MLIKRFILFLFILAFLLVNRAYADATVVEVLTLQHRTVEEVIAVLRPFVGSDGVISGMNNELIVRARPARLRQIKQILAKIDTAPRQLMITVAQNMTREEVEKAGAASGSLSIGDNARLTINDDGSDGTGAVEYRRDEDFLKARGQKVRGTELSGDIQKIRVLEGSQAFIRMGRSVPLPERTVVRNRDGVSVIGSSRYHDVSSGFYVLPRIAGDGVIVEISSRKATLGKQRSIDYLSAITRVSGKLNEWIKIGSIKEGQKERDSKIWAGRKSVGSDRRGIFLMVEKVE
jgi:hypothetical protein